MLKGRIDSSGLAGGSRAAGLKKRTMQFLKDGTLKGRRDSGCSLGLVWQGAAGFSSGCPGEDWSREPATLPDCTALE